jgi:hypothetical protein
VQLFTYLAQFCAATLVANPVKTFFVFVRLKELKGTVFAAVIFPTDFPFSPLCVSTLPPGSRYQG